jgi:rhomboid protease GluP
MCPNCRAFITVDDKTCPYCEMKLGPRAIERRSPQDVLGGLIPHARFTTLMILLINSGLYVAMVLQSSKGGGGGLDLDGQTLFDFGAKENAAILAGQWWRLITAGFLHGGLLHILMNSWVLFDLGAQVEEIYGTSRYLVIYFAGTIAGFMASAWWSNSLSIGASAGIFGLVGAMIALGLRDRSAYGAAIQRMYIRWAVIVLLIGLVPSLFGISFVDNAAHIGGGLAGFLLAYFARTPGFSKTIEGFWRGAAAICVVITAFAFVQMFMWLLSQSSR